MTTEHEDPYSFDGSLDDKQREWQKNPDSHNGAAWKSHSWSQTISDLDVRVNVPSSITKAKMVQCEINKQRLVVRCLSGDNNCEFVQLVNDDLLHPVRHTEATWSLTSGRSVHICLEKVREQWWDKLFRSEPQLKMSLMDCVRSFADLEEEAQAKIRQMRFDQEQKIKGLPTSEQSGMMEQLKNAWNKPGSPFAGTPFDPSKVNFDGSSMNISS